MENRGIRRAALVAALFGLPSALAAHEPLFGLGPHSIGKYGWALETGFEGGSDGWAQATELAYGLTPDVTVTAAVPYIFGVEGGSDGLGDVSLRGKYRFVRRDVRNASDAFAVHAGIKSSSGDRERRRGSGTRDYFVGLSYGHEGRSNYAFADLRYRLNGDYDSFERGNVLNVDAAYGIRPWKLGYRQPDLVVLVEALGEVARRGGAPGGPDTGGSTISLAPGILFSVRNVMLKLGAKFVVIDDLNGDQLQPRTEFVFAIDIHMPPFR